MLKNVNELSQGDILSSYIPPLLEVWRSANKVITLPIHGNSMYPLIQSGDTISVRLQPSLSLKVGDIILFQRNNAFLVHRLIRKKNQQGRLWIYEKGDYLAGWSMVPSCKVLGKVETIHTTAKRISLQQLPWLLINPVFGHILSVWIIGHEYLASCQRAVCGGKTHPLITTSNQYLSLLIKKFSAGIFVFLLRHSL